MNNQIELYTNDGLEIYIDQISGETFTSLAAYARMSGIKYDTVRKRISKKKGSEKLELKKLEILTNGGLQVVSLLTEEIIVDWLLGDNLYLAKQFMKLGVRKTLHEMVGYSVNTNKLSVFREQLQEVEQEYQALKSKALNLQHTIASIISSQHLQWFAEDYRCFQSHVDKLISETVEESVDKVANHRYDIYRNDAYFQKCLAYLKETKFFMSIQPELMMRLFDKLLKYKDILELKFQVNTQEGATMVHKLEKIKDDSTQRFLPVN